MQFVPSSSPSVLASSRVVARRRASSRVVASSRRRVVARTFSIVHRALRPRARRASPSAGVVVSVAPVDQL